MKPFDSMTEEEILQEGMKAVLDLRNALSRLGYGRPS